MEKKQSESKNYVQSGEEGICIGANKSVSYPRQNNDLINEINWMYNHIK